MKETRGWQDTKLGDGQNIGVVIGRFQPFHNGHAELIKTALAESDRLIIILGSAGKAPDVKNPWNELDRVAMLHSIVQDFNLNETKIRYESVQDHYKDEQWLIEAKTKIAKHVEPGDNIKLYGNDKDHSTYYLNLFPDWTLVDVGNFEKSLSATAIRELVFEGKTQEVKPLVPEGVFRYLADWQKSKDYTGLKAEYDHLLDYKKKFADLPYELVFVTVDAVITHQGKVLIQKRKAKPGEGLLAMPGGFIGGGDTLLDATLSIAEKKGGVKLDPAWLKKSRVFDGPGRSLRGRTITHVYRFDVPSRVKLKGIKGMWIDFANVSLYSDTFFEDHALILREMLK